MTIAEQVAYYRDLIGKDSELGRDPKVLADLAALDELLERNPLQKFEPHPAQRPFFDARTSIIAAFAGNRFGKTTALTVRALIECVDEECLPGHLRQFKRWNKSTAPRGTHGRIVNPSFGLLDSVVLEAFRLWCPREQLVGGSFDKAWKGPPHYRLQFKNGSFIQFMTHEQELSKFGGAARHFIGYDEPPPANIRRECKFRTIDYGGYEMFACTPLKVNAGWMRRDIFKKREAPNITVIRGSIHDNPTLNEEAKREALEDAPEHERRAREYGDFVEMGGLIYPDFERRVVPDFDTELIAGLPDHVVSIDPGIRNCGVTFGAFDGDNVARVYADLLLQDATPDRYAREIREVLSRWGVREGRVSFVIDPAAASRSQTSAESVETALGREGIYCGRAQNDVDAGIQQVRMRLQHSRIFVAESCRWLRDEADDYAAEDREDGVFKPVKMRDHVIDSLRYLCMARPWWPSVEANAPKRRLGWVDGVEPAWKPDEPTSDAPLGVMG